MNQELKQILEEFGWNFSPVAVLPNRRTMNKRQAEALNQAHSAILETIKKALPEEAKYIKFDDKVIDDQDATYVGGFNDCLSQIKSNLGVE